MVQIFKAEKNKTNFVQGLSANIFHTGRIVAKIQNFWGWLKQKFNKRSAGAIEPNVYELPDLQSYSQEECHIFVPANAENHSYYAVTRAHWEKVPEAAVLVLPESYHQPNVTFNLGQYSERVKDSIIQALDNPAINSIYLNGFSIGGATLLHALEKVVQHYKGAEKNQFDKIKRIDIRNTFSNIRNVLRFSATKLCLYAPAILLLSVLDLVWFRSIAALAAFFGLLLASLLLPIAFVIKLLAEIASWTIGIIFPRVSNSMFFAAAWVASPFVDILLARCGESAQDIQNCLRVVAGHFPDQVVVTQTLDDQVIGRNSRLINSNDATEPVSPIKIELLPKGGHVASRDTQYKQYDYLKTGRLNPENAMTPGDVAN